jgi:ATP phosphoribosyltransferase
MLTIALTKGRILTDTLPLLAQAGIVPLDDVHTSRKLVFATTLPDVSLIIIRGIDVPTYVRYGAAQMGVVGKDILLEQGADGLYEPLDLRIAQCRLMTAVLRDRVVSQGKLRVATKFVNIARDYYADKGLQVELIKLYGAMELAPLMNLADEIVDIVDTGNTLRANGMEPLETIAHISSRLIVNKAAMRSHHDQITDLIKRLESVVAGDQ